VTRFLHLQTPKAAPLALLVFFVAFAAHVPAWLEYRHDPFATWPISDAQSYDEWAQRIVARGLAAEPVFHQAPLFPVLLSAAYRLAGGAGGTWAVLLLQALLTSCAVALLVPIGRAYLGSAAAGGAGAALVILHGPLVFYGLKLLPVPVALATSAAALALLGAARERRSRTLEALAGVALGVAALARTEALLLAPIGAAALAARKGHGTARSRVVSILVYALGISAGVAPATLHNLRHGDLVLVASSGGENLFIGNQRGARGDYTPLHPRAGDIFSERVLGKAVAEKELGRTARPSEVSAFWRGRAIREVKADPAAWLALLGRKLRRVLDPGDPTDAYSFPLERGRFLPWLHVLAIPAWLLLGLGIVGLSVALERHAALAWPLAAAVAAQLATLLLFFVNTRLRLPLFFMLAPLGGFAVLEGAERWRRGAGRLGIAVAATALVALAAAGALLTRPSPRDHLRLASTFSSQGRLDEGLRALAPVLNASPPYGLALDQAGWILQKKGDFSAARERYREALAAGLPEGRGTETRTRLAQVLEKTDALAEAAAEHDRSVSSPDATAGTWYERGMFRLRQGDRAGAEADLREAARLDPSWDRPREALSRLGSGVSGRRASP
jgi:tetratricopeptide (TPR) repeat protein